MIHRVQVFCWVLLLPVSLYAADCRISQVAEVQDPFDYPGAMQAVADGKWLVVADEVSYNLKVINTATQAVEAVIPQNTGFEDLEPFGLTLSADGSKLYVSGAFAGNIAVVDVSADTPAEWTVDYWRTAGGDFGPMLTWQPDAADPATEQVLVTDRDVKGVRIFAAADGTEIAALNTDYCKLPADLAIKDGYVFVACEISNKVAVFDLADKTLLDTINVANAPTALLAHPSRPKVYVANAESITVIRTDLLGASGDDPVFYHVEDPSQGKLLSSPRDLILAGNTVWILDDGQAALVPLDPASDKLSSSQCTGIGSYANHALSVRGEEGETIYIAHGDGVEYTTLNLRFTRLRPQVLMAGFDPMLFDVQDNKFSILAVVEEGAAPLETVSFVRIIEGADWVPFMEMNPVGTIPLTVENGRKIDGVVYKATIDLGARGLFPEGAIATQVLGLPSYNLFGDLTGQFHLHARDQAQQTHAYPIWYFGDWPLIENDNPRTADTLPNYSERGPQRVQPQVIMAGFTPMLMDITETEVKIIAVVRPGIAEISWVGLKTMDGAMFTKMHPVAELLNGDKVFEGTVVNLNRGQQLFPAETRFAYLWNQVFHVEVMDKQGNNHRFPDFRAGSYPEVHP